jgi:hypothetical protein
VIDEPLQTSATDPEQLAFAKQKERDREAQRRARWRHQLSTYEGRQFIWDELFAALFAYIPPGDQALLGVRNEELRRWALANEHTDLFLQMQREAMARAKQDRDEARSSRVKRTDTPRTS